MNKNLFNYKNLWMQICIFQTVYDLFINHRMFFDYSNYDNSTSANSHAENHPRYIFDQMRLKLASIDPCGSSVGK